MDKDTQNKLNDLVETYAGRVFSSYGVEEGYEYELYDLIFLRQDIHELLESVKPSKLDLNRLHEIDSQWQSDAVDNHDSIQFEIDREKIPQSMWWYWIDQLDKLSEEDLKTL